LDGAMMATSLTKKTCTTTEAELGRLFRILRKVRNVLIVEITVDVITVIGETSGDLYCRY
jgi:hypothetical protein